MNDGLYPVEVPPEMIPKNMAEAFVEIGKLQVICRNQETKLKEHDQEVSQLKDIIATANGVKMALFWAAATLLGVTTIYYNIVNGRLFGK